MTTEKNKIEIKQSRKKVRFYIGELLLLTISNPYFPAFGRNYEKFVYDYSNPRIEKNRLYVTKQNTIVTAYTKEPRECSYPLSKTILEQI